MTRTRVRFSCTECGAQAPKWLGRCPECGGWDTLAEESVPNGAKASSGSGPIDRPIPLGEVDTGVAAMRPTGIEELDRVLGGGLVGGSVTLLGGEPGIGKSTLMLQALARMAALAREARSFARERPVAFGLVFTPGADLDLDPESLARASAAVIRIAAELAGEVEQAVRVVGVAATQPLPLEVEPDGGGVLGHPPPLEHHLLPGDAVLAGHRVDGRGVVDGGGGAVELEAVPDHLDLVAVLELLEGQREVPPAEVAEGAEDVGPHVDTHVTRVCRPPRRSRNRSS